MQIREEGKARKQPIITANAHESLITKLQHRCRQAIINSCRVYWDNTRAPIDPLYFLGTMQTPANVITDDEQQCTRFKSAHSAISN